MADNERSTAENKAFPPRPQRAPATPRSILTKRAFCRWLKNQGASKRQAEAVTSTLPPEVQRALLPAWVRLVIVWKSRHE